MEAKDGSFGFDFEGIYNEVVHGEKFTFTMPDRRVVNVIFKDLGDKTEITITFDAENENPVEMQQQGWQSILDNFKKYATLYDVTSMKHLDYPIYFLTILGIWKMLGVIALLVPKFPLLKEWAYAGFFFMLLGASISHIALGDSASEWTISLFLLSMTIVSWYFRPADRKINFNKSV